MLVVATDDFEAYHGLVGELRDRGVTFTTIEPSEPVPEETAAVLTTAADAVSLPDNVTRIEADPSNPRSAVDRALAQLRSGDGRLIIGVDPGEQPGIAVLSGSQVIAAFQVPVTEVPAIIRAEIADAPDPLVRIGDGARLEGAQLVEALEDVRVEMVDETASTPHLGTGARGMGDVLAAVNIARRSGEVVETVDIEPTAGEIQAVKNRSRERTGNDTLPSDLAKRVATGELSLEEALARHRNEDPPE